MDSDMRDGQDIGSNDVDAPDWPPNRPARAALDFLQLALTDGIPSPSFSDAVQIPVIPVGSRSGCLTLTLPLEGPDFARPMPNMLIPAAPEDSIPEPELRSLSFDDLSQMVVDDVRDALLSPQEEQGPDTLTNTASDRSLRMVLHPPRPGMPPLRQQPNGILRLDCSIHAPHTSSPTAGMDDVSKQTPDDPNSTQRPTKSQLPQGEADLEPSSDVVEPQPKRKMTKIKSRLAVLYLREKNKREEEEAKASEEDCDG